jgi:hypothetical protein
MIKKVFIKIFLLFITFLLLKNTFLFVKMYVLSYTDYNGIIHADSLGTDVLPAYHPLPCPGMHQTNWRRCYITPSFATNIYY